LTVLSAVAPLLALAFVLWLALGRPGRSAGRRSANRRRGGRKARDRNVLGLPARDRAFQPGLILLVLTVIALVRVIGEATVSGGSGPAWTAFWFGLVIAGGYAVRPGIVAAGMSHWCWNGSVGRSVLPLPVQLRTVCGCCTQQRSSWPSSSSALSCPESGRGTGSSGVP
jgi:hypothetical protein